MCICMRDYVFGKKHNKFSIGVRFSDVLLICFRISMLLTPIAALGQGISSALVH